MASHERTALIQIGLARAVEVSQSRLKIREVLCPRPLSTAGPCTKISLTLKPQILKMSLDGFKSSSAFKGFRRSA
jgi:hypothetical protein